MTVQIKSPNAPCGNFKQSGVIGVQLVETYASPPGYELKIQCKYGMSCSAEMASNDVVTITLDKTDGGTLPA